MCKPRLRERISKKFRSSSAFQEIEAHLHSEINTWGYPKAALLGFCAAPVAYNVLAVVKAALRATHGEERIDNELSGYYLAGNIFCPIYSPAAVIAVCLVEV